MPGQSRWHPLCPDTKMSIPFPHISIEETLALYPHEYPDSPRVERVMHSIQQDGILRNPVIVTPIKNGFVLLDGTNRLEAFRRLSIPYIPVQIVSTTSPDVQLKSWAHQVSDAVEIDEEVQSLFQQFQAEVQVAKALSSFTPCEEKDYLLSYITPRTSLTVYLKGRAVKKAALLNHFVNSLRKVDTLYRFNPEDEVTLRNTHQYAYYRVFRKDQIVEMAKKREKLPCGITRFQVAGRALGLDVPLSVLSRRETLEAKKSYLKKLLEERKKARKIRLYSEPVYIFND